MAGRCRHPALRGAVSTVFALLVLTVRTCPPSFRLPWRSSTTVP